MLWMAEIHFAPPRKPWFLVIPLEIPTNNGFSTMVSKVVRTDFETIFHSMGVSIYIYMYTCNVYVKSKGHFGHPPPPPPQIWVFLKNYCVATCLSPPEKNIKHTYAQ